MTAETKAAATGEKRKASPAPEEVEGKKSKVVENRAVYVTNLPHDTNEHEIAEVFGKYGLIDQGLDGNPRVKMYRNEEGEFNGEALVVYFKSASVHLAIQMHDDYEFRLGETANGNIRVREADMSYKRNKNSDTVASKIGRKDKKAHERTRADMNRRLAEWSDNEEEVKEAFAPKKNKWAKVAIIKHAFTLDELEEDVEAVAEITEDMRKEGEKYGQVTNVTVYDKEPDGIVTMRFREFDSVETFMSKTNGRKYSERALEITIAEDKPRFEKSTQPDSEEEEKNLGRLVENHD